MPAKQTRPPFRRVNLKLNPIPHAAVTHYVKNNHVTLQDYLHSLIVRDMLQKGLLRTKSKKPINC